MTPPTDATDLTGDPAPSGAAQVTLQEAADLLGVHYMTAYRYVRTGMLPAVKVGATWQVERSEVEAMRSGAPSSPKGQGRAHPAPWAERLEQRLRAGDEAGSWKVLEAALSAGAEPRTVYTEVIAPAMRGIGDAWARGELDVAVEHRASVITMRLLGRLGPRFVRRGQSRGDVVLGAPSGDDHGLPVAMVADLVRGVGYSAVDLGADVPARSLAWAVREAARLVAVVLTVTTRDNEAGVAESIAAVREVAPDVTILVGGGGVDDEAHARSMGADGWAADVDGALVLLDEAAGRGRTHVR